MLSGLFILNVVTMYLIEGTFFYSINMLFNKTLGLLNSYSQIGYRTFKNVISQPSRYNFDALIEVYNVLRNGIFVLYKDFNSMALWANVFETGFTPRIDATPVTGMEALTSFQKVQRELNPIFSLSSDFNIYLNPQDQLMFSILGGPEKIESREAFLSEYFGLSREFFENEKYVIKHTDINAKEFYDKLWEILQKLPYDNGGYLFESSLQFADSIQREFLLKDLFLFE